MDAVKTIPTNFKKKTLAAALLFFCTFQSLSQTGLIGKWTDKDHKEKQVEMYVGSNGKIYGKSENGFIGFKDLIYDAASKTYSGLLVNPDNNEEFKISIQQPASGVFTLW
jgi:hypothetical protein